MKFWVGAAAIAAGIVLAGCGSTKVVQAPARVSVATASCPAADRAGWQQLADRIGAAVYCPSWMPDPFTGRLHDHQWNTIYSVDPKDHSYLMGFIWLEPGSGELHVNLRGYPGRKAVPTCLDTETTGGQTTRHKVPCFQDQAGTKRFGKLRVAVYTRNQDADLWHVLYAWHAHGGLYTLSQHVTPPLTYAKVIADLNRMMRGLTAIEPAS